MTSPTDDEKVRVKFIVNQREHGRQVIVLGDMDEERRRWFKYSIFSVLNASNHKKLLNILPKEDDKNEE